MAMREMGAVKGVATQFELTRSTASSSPGCLETLSSPTTRIECCFPKTVV